MWTQKHFWPEQWGLLCSSPVANTDKWLAGSEARGPLQTLGKAARCTAWDRSFPWRLTSAAVLKGVEGLDGVAQAAHGVHHGHCRGGLWGAVG